jgi:predicted ATPase/class 3 adenylate cyclase
VDVRVERSERDLRGAPARGAQRLPAGTVTFVFTDVEGSTRLLEKLTAEPYAAALAEHRRALRAPFEARGGVEVDTQGDAFFFAFPTAPDAVEAAAAGQAALAGGPIRVRMGVYTGTPLVTDEGYVGADVHRAARIAAAGHGGQVLVSSSTAALVAGAELCDLGEHRFKDLAAAERVYQLGEGEFPPLKSLCRTNLPVPATPFVGRGDELASVVELLRRDDVRLLTLSGPGGTGKTRLALQAAAEAAAAFPDGITWVALAPLRDASLAGVAVAQALGIREQPDVEPMEALMSALRGKAALLLLDNAEHLLPAVADLVAGLAGADGPTVLVTSRERLRLQGEHTWPVPQLSAPDAVELFLAQARRVDVGFQQSSAVGELCARLDHLPLAVELAAARTAVFSPEQLLERIGERLDLLKGPRDADPRQRTLRATIEWSYELLDDDEQALFRSLSVFAGGSTFEAAEQVCGATPDTLESLLDKNLLRHRAAASGRRYFMLETIREFAAEQLLQAELTQDMRLRHARFFDAMGTGAAEETERGVRLHEWLDRLADELDNMRVASTHAAEIGNDPLRLGLTTAFANVAANGTGYTREARAVLDEALSGAVHAPALVRARALRALGAIAFVQGDPSAAKQPLQDALDLHRAIGDELGVAFALLLLGPALSYEGDANEAKRMLEESRSVFRRQGQMVGAVAADMNLGLRLIQGRDLAEARTVLERALAEVPLDDMRSGILCNLGLSALLDGGQDAAEKHYRAALEQLHEREVDFACYGVEGLAASWIAQGIHLSEAATLLTAAASMRAELGTRPVGEELELVEHAIAEARRLLPEERHTAAVAAGSTMPIDEAVQYALSVV